MKSEQADYATIQAQWGNLSGNELTRKSSGNTRPQSSKLTEPLWTNPGIKSGNSARKLISTEKKKKAQAGNDWSNILPKIITSKKKATINVAELGINVWPELYKSSHLGEQLYNRINTVLFESSPVCVVSADTPCQMLSPPWWTQCWCHTNDHGTPHTPQTCHHNANIFSSKCLSLL